jgi:hypothetical protein
MKGPIDFIIIGFEGNNFDGSILKAISGALDKGTIGLVALALVSKSPNGTVRSRRREICQDYYEELPARQS